MQKTERIWSLRGTNVFEWSLDGASVSVHDLELAEPLNDLRPLPGKRLLVSRLGAAPCVYDGNFELLATLGEDEAFASAVQPDQNLILIYDGPNDARLENPRLPGRYNDRLLVFSSSGAQCSSSPRRRSKSQLGPPGVHDDLLLPRSSA